jgi:hypothetical protein
MLTPREKSNIIYNVSNEKKIDFKIEIGIQ